ncbi:MAG: phenylalanine--tRNA ligase subunit beta [bacterium]|nr:phenylalanine--tRNA ligase subunit beta [bacterium]
MKFSYNWLKEYFDKIPDYKKVVDLITNHAFEVEEVKKQGSDYILDIKILANRPDCFSYLGIAKELSAILNKKIKLPVAENLTGIKKQGKSFNVEVKDKKLCPRYTAILMKGVRVKESPKWLRQKLEASGLNSINNIVDAANYAMLETGQPLHVFDFAKIGDKNIIVRKAKKGEQITTLDDNKFVLDENILVIADSKDSLAIAGIKGGKKAEITEKTKDILIESANFQQLVIRKGSQKLALRTDSSLRFEHGLDPNLTLEGMKRVVFLIKEVAGGAVEEIADFYPAPIKNWKIKLNFKKVEKILGIAISIQEIIKILQGLGLKIIKKEKDSVLIEVPTLRKDLLLQEDLVEEICRIYGVEKILAKEPMIHAKPVDTNESNYLEEKIRDFLKELKFSEVFNYSFISQTQKNILKYSNHSLVELENPLSSEFQYLRPSLIPNFLDSAKKNLRYFDKFQIFEIGKIFSPNGRKKSIYDVQGIEEKKSMAFLMADKNKKMELDDFRFLKGITETFLQELGIADSWFDDVVPLIQERIIFWHPKRLATIKIQDKTIGQIGEANPALLKNLNIDANIMVAEFDLEELIKISREERTFSSISAFPSVVRDISILVPLEVKIDEVVRKIDQLGGKLISDIELFDIYSEEELFKGKQSLAFRIIFQSENKTLSSEEIDNLMKNIIMGLEKQKDWQVRK